MMFPLRICHAVFQRLNKEGRNIPSLINGFCTKSFLRTQKTTTVRGLMSGRKKTSGKKGYWLLIIPVSTFCLGTWQIERRKWKLNLIKELEILTTSEPLSFPKNLEELKNLEYRKVRIKGQFDNSKELYVMPRPQIQKDECSSGGLITRQMQSGAQVITAFQLDGTNTRVLVNRGWVPKSKVNPRTRKEGQVEGVTELVAVVRKSEKRPAFGGKNDIGRNHWFNKDSEAMAMVLNTQPIMLDADQASTIPGGPIGGQTKVTLRNEHMSYILTWYSLSFLTGAMWIKTFLLKR